MNPDLAIVLLCLAAAIAMFAANRPRMDAVGLLVLTVLPFTGVLTMNETLAGFSDPNIVLIAALFVLGDGLVRTGVARRVGDWLIARAGDSETRLMVLLMVVVAALGSVMSSTGVVAIFIPIVLRVAASTGTAPSRLMMPLSVAALISGMMTLVATTPNLIVSGALTQHGSDAFGFFAFTPFGVPVLALGILYMLFARRWLAAGGGAAADAHRPTLATWIERYGLAEREYRVRIGAASPLVGRRLGDLDLRAVAGANIVAIERAGRFAPALLRPVAGTELQADDLLLVDLFAHGSTIAALCRHYALEELPLTGAYFSDRAQEIGMAEVMVGADATLVGGTLIEAQFRSRFGLTVIGLRRGRAVRTGGLREERLRIGDTLLLVGPWKEIDRLRGSGELVILNLPAERDEVLPVTGRAPQAIFSLALVVTLMVTGAVPNVQAGLIGCLLLGALRCTDLDTAYRSIHWKSLVLIVGMLPFSLALQRTGGVDLAAEALAGATGSLGPRATLACVFAITALLGMFVSNTATAVLMAPVALAIADKLQASPYPFAMIVALAASTAFMTPISSPVNTLVVGPGNYVFGDFVRVGVPLAVVVLLVSVLLVPLFLPL
ncbi:MAG: SLC13 family permease [Candidatus Binatia bacterium]